MSYAEDLPYSVEIDGQLYKIRDNCEHRLILKCIRALNDFDLPEAYKRKTAFIIFYEDYELIENYDLAVEEMLRIIGCHTKKEYGNLVKKHTTPKTIVNWEKDYKYIAPAASRILGYDVRTPDKYTHWYSFIGAFLEIGADSIFSKILLIRNKMQKGIKLEPGEREFYRTNYDDIILPKISSPEEAEWLDSDW